MEHSILPTRPAHFPELSKALRKWSHERATSSVTEPSLRWNLLLCKLHFCQSEELPDLNDLPSPLSFLNPRVKSRNMELLSSGTISFSVLPLCSEDFRLAVPELVCSWVQKF